MYRMLTVATALVATATSCGSSISTSDEAAGNAADGATTTTTASAVESVAPSTDALLLNISIHVEGHNAEVRNEAEYRAHAQQIREVADAAAAAGASLSFEVSAPFVDAAVRWSDTILTDLLAQGHAVGVHADLDVPDLETFTAQLTDMRSSLAAAGVETAFVSGICSEGPWVEAAIAAGFTASDGMVEWCLKSIPAENWPAGYDYVGACASPADCHGSIPGGTERAMHPWFTCTSADWLTDDPDGELLLVGGSGQGVHCLSEDLRGIQGRCALDEGDIDLFVEMIAEHVAARTPGEINVLTLSWSIGNVTTPEMATALFTTVDEAFTDKEVVWSTIPAIEDAVR